MAVGWNSVILIILDSMLNIDLHKEDHNPNGRAHVRTPSNGYCISLWQNCPFGADSSSSRGRWSAVAWCCWAQLKAVSLTVILGLQNLYVEKTSGSFLSSQRRGPRVLGLQKSLSQVSPGVNPLAAVAVISAWDEFIVIDKMEKTWHPNNVKTSDKHGKQLCLLVCFVHCISMDHMNFLKKSRGGWDKMNTLYIFAEEG